jgi:hypothetical protein
LNQSQEAQKKYFPEGTAVVYRRAVRRVHLQRCIMSRIVYKWEEVKVDEILVLYDNFLYLQNLSMRDPSFSEKYGKTLEVLAKDLRSLNLKTGIPANVGRSLNIKFQKVDYNNFLIPLRNLPQSEKTLMGAYRLKSTKLRVRQPETPPKRFIGIGYKDKGSARDIAWDGSPTWQEVAMSLRVREVKF